MPRKSTKTKAPAQPEKSARQKAQDSYAKRMRNKGFRRKTIWIPGADADRVEKYAEKLRAKHETSAA